eukprot:m.32097 g.32097  ORF g.32097 m.32097 type:complete len:61 (-) comp9363_c0_seq2:55-237(-)
MESLPASAARSGQYYTSVQQQLDMIRDLSERVALRPYTAMEVETSKRKASQPEAEPSTKR